MIKRHALWFTIQKSVSAVHCNNSVKKCDLDHLKIQKKKDLGNLNTHL